MAANITTLTFFKYTNWLSKIWAFGMMQFAHSYLSEQSGIQFYKLMGSGKGKGFNPFPDWSTYALLIVWKDERSANDFFQNAELFQKYKNRTAERWTIFMKSILARGSCQTKIHSTFILTWMKKMIGFASLPEPQFVGENYIPFGNMFLLLRNH